MSRVTQEYESQLREEPLYKGTLRIYVWVKHPLLESNGLLLAQGVQVGYKLLLLYPYLYLDARGLSSTHRCIL